MNDKISKDRSLIPVERIERSILLIRGHKVILDADLAALYGVETKQLIRAVKRNLLRFPDDFMSQRNKEESENLRFHFGTSSQWGGRRYPPYAFTEQGVAMSPASSGVKGPYRSILRSCGPSFACEGYSPLMLIWPENSIHSKRNTILNLK